MHDFKDWRIAVIGAGTMGKYIAQYFASVGLKTHLYNRSEDKLKKAYEEIKENLDILISMKAIEAYECPQQVLDNLKCVINLEEAVEHADLVLECVSEDIAVKKLIFERINKAAPLKAYICSDTSALNIYEEIPNLRPEKTLITHFFNPPHVMPLVEIVRGEKTPQETVEIISEFLKAAGKQPIVINKCIPGFIFNRLLAALEREAMYIVEQGAAAPQDIDTVIKTTFGPRFAFEGIFDLLDHVGLDVEAAVIGDLLPELCNDVTVPRILLAQAEKGNYGIKTGKGFKNYSGENIENIKKERTVRIVRTLNHINRLRQTEK